VIAQALILLFPLLAAAPCLAALLLRSLPGEEREPAWVQIAIVGAFFLAWQWGLNLWGYSSSSWVLWSRLVDPFFLVGFLTGTLRAENGIAKFEDDRHRRFLIQMLPWLAVNLVVQSICLLVPSMSSFLSFLTIIVFGLKIVEAYSRWTVRWRVRQRFSVVAWVLSSLVTLPFARIFFLTHLAMIWIGRLVQQIRIVNDERKAQEHEKVVIAKISETLTTVIQDVSNFQQSMLNYLQGLCDTLEVKSGAVYLWDGEAKRFRVAQVYGLFFPLNRSVEHTFMREKALHELVFSLDVTESDDLVWQCGQERKPIHLAYASQDPRILKLGGRGNNIQSLVLTPLVLEHELLGVMVLQNKHYERYFTESDAYLVYTFAHYATLMINATRTLKDRAEKERVQNELMLGQKIQSDLLPHRIPVVKGIDLAGSMIPAKEIGGDYYDFIEVDSTRLGIAIGDVSGKGVPAGMLMTILHTLLHSQYRYFTNTKDLLVDINASLALKIKSSMFITFLFFEWKCEEKTLMYTSCGHEHILHYKALEHRLECFRSGGIALGMTEDNSAIIRERQLPVAPGDTVLLYSDGVIEARNPNGDMYTLDRLKQFAEQHQGQTAEQIRQALMDSLDQFRRGADQVDDITCLVMRF